ncbi:hypothetical protein MKX01_022252, partial [Papaver californicum]
MEAVLQVQRPVCNTNTNNITSRRNILDRTHLKIKPFLGFSFHVSRNKPSSQSSLQFKENQGVGISYRVIASADFLRRPKKGLVQRPKSSSPKGFSPRVPTGTSTQKRGQRDDAEIVDSSSTTSTAREYSGHNDKVTELESDSDEEQQIEHTPGKKMGETRVKVGKNVPSNEQVTVNCDETVDKGVIVETKEDLDAFHEPAILKKSVTKAEADVPTLAKSWSDVIKSNDVKEIKMMGMSPHNRTQILEELALENSLGNKIFVYPQIVKPDQEVEVFLNRSISALKNEENVLLMGAFNDWKWKSFTIKLNKAELKGDWWSCRVYVPKEAYKIDFVFFNGEGVYENNVTNDFHVAVQGGFDEVSFEEFLLEERQRELEKIAAEKAEKERREEEQRQIEAEKAARKADRAQAKMEIEKRKEMITKIMTKAVISVDNVWHISPKEFKGEDVVRLYYNKTSGPLAYAKDLWIHGGHNNWNNGVTIVAKLVLCDRKDGDWWYAYVPVPARARVLDWVLADGPPEKATLYDNNKLQDFHAVVPNSTPEEMYWFEEEQQLYNKLQEERRLREEALKEKAERTARMRAERKERTIKEFLLSQKNIVYTEPLEVQAGSTATLYYNPSNTILNGKPEVWFRCSFNRWTHRKGPLPPQKMLPADNFGQVKAT